MEKEIQIPDGFEAKIEGSKVVFVPEDENTRKFLIDFIKLENGVNLSPDDAERCIGYLEKQKEQKPVENIVYPHYLTLDEAIRLYYYTYGNGKGGFDYISLPKFQDIVEEFVKNYGQKPAEWSEGIKKTLDEISNYLKYKGREEDADFIRNLRPQPHWKPSKEQIKAIDLAIRFVTDDFDEHPTLSETLREFYNELLKNYSYD